MTMDNNDPRGPVGLRHELDPRRARPTQLRAPRVLEAHRFVAGRGADLSATPAGQRIYEKLGFTLTAAPRMKLVL